MKTQYLNTMVALLFTLSLGCSTHPEIKPYQADSSQELAVDDNAAKEESIDLPDVGDGLVEDAELPAETPTTVVENSEEVVKPASEPQPVVAEKKVASRTKDIAPAKSVSSRVPASANHNGYYIFSSNCEMKSSPDSAAKSVGSVSKGKKLWLDSHNSHWFKAYKKSGTAFISASCIKNH